MDDLLKFLKKSIASKRLAAATDLMRLPWYFAMLGVINLISCYFTTLKKHREIPVLPSLKTSKEFESVSLLPSLPRQITQNVQIKIRPCLVEGFKSLYDQYILLAHELSKVVNNYDFPSDFVSNVHSRCF